MRAFGFGWQSPPHCSNFLSCACWRKFSPPCAHVSIPYGVLFASSPTTPHLPRSPSLSPPFPTSYYFPLSLSHSFTLSLSFSIPLPFARAISLLLSPSSANSQSRADRQLSRRAAARSRDCWLWAFEVLGHSSAAPWHDSYHLFLFVHLFSSLSLFSFALCSCNHNRVIK